MGRSLAYLVVAVALSQLVANLAPVLVTFRSPDDLVAAGVFGATFVLARIPLFLFAPVQAILVPMLTRAAALGERTELVRRLRQALALALVAGGAGVVGCLVLGPWAAEVLFGTATRPPASTVGLLGLATLLMMAALVVQPVLVALGEQRSVTVVWLIGSVLYVGLLLLPVQPTTAALIAQLTAPALVFVLLLAEAYRALRPVRQ